MSHGSISKYHCIISQHHKNLPLFHAQTLNASSKIVYLRLWIHRFCSDLDPEMNKFVPIEIVIIDEDSNLRLIILVNSPVSVLQNLLSVLFNNISSASQTSSRHFCDYLSELKIVEYCHRLDQLLITSVQVLTTHPGTNHLLNTVISSHHSLVVVCARDEFDFHTKRSVQLLS